MRPSLPTSEEAALPKPRKAVLWLLAGYFAQQLPLLIAIAPLDLVAFASAVVAGIMFPALFVFCYYNPEITRTKSPLMYRLLWPREGLDLMFCCLLAINAALFIPSAVAGVIVLMRYSPGMGS